MTYSDATPQQRAAAASVEARRQRSRDRRSKADRDAARALTDHALADRLDRLAEDPQGFPRGQRSALLAEAALRIVNRNSGGPQA